METYLNQRNCNQIKVQENFSIFCLNRKFFSSKNFEGWFWQRQVEVNHKLSVLHLEALCNADLLQWASDKQEVQVVDLVLKLREKMVSSSQALSGI